MEEIKSKREKKISRMVLEEAIKEYDFDQDVTSPIEELLGIEEQVLPVGIMNIKEMTTFIQDHLESKLFRINWYDRSAIYIKDEELRYIDGLLDDEKINKLLSNKGYTPCTSSLL